jgi:transposase
VTSSGAEIDRIKLRVRIRRSGRRSRAVVRSRTSPAISGSTPKTLRERVRQAEADHGLRPDLPMSEEREEIKRLRQEHFELRRAKEILKSATMFFAKELDPDREGRHY